MFDLIHGTFGIAITIFTILNIIKLYKDKKVRGVSILFPIYLCIFNTWNIFYLFNLHQILASISGILVLIVNSIWLGQMIYYLKKESDASK